MDKSERWRYRERESEKQEWDQHTNQKLTARFKLDDFRRCIHKHHTIITAAEATAQLYLLSSGEDSQPDLHSSAIAGCKLACLAGWLLIGAWFAVNLLLSPPRIIYASREIDCNLDFKVDNNHHQHHRQSKYVKRRRMNWERNLIYMKIKANKTTKAKHQALDVIWGGAPASPYR